MSQVVSADKDSDKYVTLDAHIWEELPIAHIYFVYMNPMFVTSAIYGGYQCVLISLISVYVLSMLREIAYAR